MRFVNTSTPRSGTKYFAELMQNLRINCGHEATYTDWGPNYEKPFKWKHYQGESSYLLVPHLETIRDCYIINQKRRKEDCIASMKRKGILKHFEVPKMHYFNYIAHYIPELKTISDYEERLSYFYDKWNEWALMHADLSYFVEDMDEYLLGGILFNLNIKVGVADLRYAIENTVKKHEIEVQCQ